MSNLIISFNRKKTPTAEEILSSDVFLSLTRSYLERLEKSKPSEAMIITKTFGEKKEDIGIRGFLMRLLKDRFQDIQEEYQPFASDKESAMALLDGIYDVWRKCERYATIDRSEEKIPSMSFISLTDSFSEAIIGCYRRIYENVLGSEQTVYRQLPSGVNAGFMLNSSSSAILPADLNFLKKTKTVDALVIRPPFICSSKENTRVGTFFDKDERLKEGRYQADDFLMAPILIKGRVGYVYVKKDYLSFLVAMGNLFQMTTLKDVEGLKPSFIVVFGADVDDDLTYYYKDEDVYVGLVPQRGHIAYFGYLKKIILTLHNLSMIDEGKLPIHGAGIEITLNNGRVYNVVLLGDSGAGKSETIEALKRVQDGSVEEVKTIFDDMGTFSLRDGSVMTQGTEIGAFVRLDDLEKGYSLKSIDRAIYINVDRVNSRVVVPIESYQMSKTLHRVDVFLLADNFTDTDEGLIRYENKRLAEEEFIKGERVAKGTTSESGKVSTFFANPFGPVQRQEECKPLIDMFFTKLFESQVYVGRIYTRLSIDPVHGPEKGAQALFELLNSLK